jgi:4a-hydroxytetrahydrobiopterin dehydratase
MRSLNIMAAENSRPAEPLLALAARHCKSGAAKLGGDALAVHLSALPGWSRRGEQIEKSYRFGNFHETIGFVNALAWIANREDHHPDLAVSFDRCVVAWSTHDAGGITDNDAICAARTDRLLG